MWKGTSDRIERVLKLYEQVLIHYKNDAQMVDLVCSVPPAVSIFLWRLVTCNLSTAQSMRRAYELVWARDKYDPNKKHEVLLDAAHNAMSHAIKKLQTIRNISHKKRITKGFTSFTSIKCNASNCLDGLKSNNNCRKAFLKYTEDVHARHFLPTLQGVKDSLQKAIEKTNRMNDLAQDIYSIVWRYIRKWNESKKTIMLLKPEINISITNNSWVICKYENSVGQQYRFDDRSIDHWIADGHDFSSYEIFESQVHRHQAEVCFSNPTKWVTLDNYEVLLNKNTLIEKIEDTLIDPSGNTIAFSVSNEPNTPLPFCFFIYFKKDQDGTYRTIPNNQALPAKKFAQRMKLAQQILS